MLLDRRSKCCGFKGAGQLIWPAWIFLTWNGGYVNATRRLQLSIAACIVLLTWLTSLTRHECALQPTQRQASANDERGEVNLICSLASCLGLLGLQLTSV